MKRIVVVCILMMVAASVAFGQGNRSRTKHRMRASCASATDPVAEMLIAKEKQITEALMKKDTKTFNSLVAGDGFLNTPHGRMNVADFTKVMFGPDYSLSNSTVEDPQVTMIDTDAAILTYKSSGTETYQGSTQTSTSYATTIWVKRGGVWKAIFHQESMSAPSGPSTSSSK
ncbi:MAG: hypothetical protein AUG75_15065 [Cyanobacteria bacterium 13_1_20CM_4_61_6]|nr:MAG: hypothetical protein AUG75_15065 [Cyanobacteria bacterium 13_1_20CM_4_61_6]